MVKGKPVASKEVVVESAEVQETPRKSVRKPTSKNGRSQLESKA